MSEDRLDKIFDVLVDNDIIDIEDVSPAVVENLKYHPRPYQIEAFARTEHYLNKYKKRRKPTQLLYHMATGSGKTLIMAGQILELFKLGYRNFVFFVNTDTIIRKTKENFLNPSSSKYLFEDRIVIDGQDIKIEEVENFASINPDGINMIFSTIQGLHSRLNNPKENSVTFEDFIDKKIVLISDEAHHINSLTKKKLSTKELALETSWETTVNRIFNSNADNIMLEFTATLELSHPAIASKYNSLLLFDYPLAKFREDRYSKEVKTNQIDFDPIERIFVGLLISQYKKKIFANNGLIIKPVILLKSKTTSESANIEKEFLQKLKSLNSEYIQTYRTYKNETLIKAFKCFDSLQLSNQNIVDEIKDEFSEDKVISINSTNDSTEKQIIINSLEDQDNPYRLVFAVDKLNEGWDVLNLFDIVRLYDTRDSKGSNPGKTTVQEAQLIGRGARYCPFKLQEEDEVDKRKYDDDLENELRVCETLHYHCSHNPRYIEELTKALREIGIVPEERVEVHLKLKNDFKETSLYRSGFIMLNKKVANNPKTLLEYQEPELKKNFQFSLRTHASSEQILFDSTESKKSESIKRESKVHAIVNWNPQLIKKAMNGIPLYRFDKLRRYFPSIKSIDDFLSNEKYLRDVKITVIGSTADINDLSEKQKFSLCKKALIEISSTIATEFGDYRGTQQFQREPIRKIFRDKKLYFTEKNNSDAETGKPTMRPDIPDKYFINLDQKEWYAFEENYGSSEEKFLVKYLDEQMTDLKAKFSEIYLLRNERFFKLFRFSDGKATEPDFVLFLSLKESEDVTIYQLFIEPKGQHLIENDIWKEDFLKSIESTAKVNLFENQRFRLVGMPFYNETQRKTEFENKLKSI